MLPFWAFKHLKIANNLFSLEPAVLEILSQNPMLVVAGLVAFLFGAHLLVTLVALIAARNAQKERTELNRELFGLLKKIEGLTSSRREQMLRHYDGLLESLTNRLPAAVASHTSQVIFEAESKILTRLAELDPDLTKDESSKARLDELVRHMESLESTIVNLTADAVKHVMVDGRRALYEANPDLDIRAN